MTSSPDFRQPYLIDFALQLLISRRVRKRLRLQVYDQFFPFDRRGFQCPHFGEQVLQLQFRLHVAGIDPVEF